MKLLLDHRAQVAYSTFLGGANLGLLILGLIDDSHTNIAVGAFGVGHCATILVHAIARLTRKES